MGDVSFLRLLFFKTETIPRVNQSEANINPGEREREKTTTTKQQLHIQGKDTAPLKLSSGARSMDRLYFPAKIMPYN